MSTDIEWERWGQKDPYFGVLTHEKFRRSNITEDSRAEFLQTGRLHVEYVLGICRQRIDPNFAPSRVLDFGCGVGRVLIPFAEQAAEAVGVDVSPSMLAEAERNCTARGLTNVRLAPSDDLLSALEGDFDLVHSCIVLQHIELARGRLLFQRLIERVRAGGIGALHVTFAWDIYLETFGQPPPPVSPPRLNPLRQVATWLKSIVVPPDSEAAVRDDAADPEMQMNFYNLSELLFVLRHSGIERLHTELTDHGGAYGAFLFFRKPA